MFVEYIFPKTRLSSILFTDGEATFVVLPIIPATLSSSAVIFTFDIQLLISIFSAFPTIPPTFPFVVLIFPIT